MSSEFSIFRPRPEAQATTWAELIPPVQTAVHDLLVRIEGAHQSINSEKSDESSDRKPKQTGNCFLVYGSRGTGKTTVLLNAQRAACRRYGNTFFNEAKDPLNNPDQEKARKARKEDAEKHADNLRNGNLVWLEILNLEPLPSEANLLTVLLTQIRKALHSHNDKRHSERRSIFEEEADSARQQLNKLINDATLMWQNVKEADTRNLSNGQVKAAEIYAGFQESFKKAMDKLVKELSDAPDTEKKLSIVLPIDNIDRSTDHLQSIVKLAQLVSHPNLWLVMAGDRDEVETFLERAYWKELIRSSDGADARGKMDSDNEDEALVMARRQANTTAQKLWPANHRVEVNLVQPEDTLAFKYRHHSGSLETKNISELFGSIQIPTTRLQREDIFTPSEEDRLTLFDFFDISKNVKENWKPNECLTRAAYHGLLLPARSVIDLWQLLDWLVEEKESSSSRNDFKAEKVARTMLRIAIASSDMPSGLAQDLQNDILRRGEKGGTILDFSNYSLKVKSMTSANHDFEHALTPVFSQSEKYQIRSKLVIRNIEDIVLSLKYNYSPMKPLKSFSSHVKNPYPQPFVIETANESQPTELPSQITAWLMVLHDILILAEGDATSWVLGSLNIEAKYSNVSVHHTTVEGVLKKYIKMEAILPWSPPKWGLFWGRNIFSLRWQDFRKTLADKSKQNPNKFNQTAVTKLLAAGWVLCALKSSFELIKAIDLKFPLINKFENIFIEFSTEEKQLDFEKLTFQRVMTAVNIFYNLIQETKKSPPDCLAAYEIIIKTGIWMETELVYFLSSSFVPIESINDSIHRIEEIKEALNKSVLIKHWENNLAFILAELHVTLPAFENDDNLINTKPSKQSTSEKTNNEGGTNTKSLAELIFADDLHTNVRPLDN